MSPSITLDLFDVPEFPSSAVSISAFDSWAASRARTVRGLSEPTEAVQRTMWTAFETWCNQNRIELSALTAKELNAYLLSREGSVPASELTPRYAWRLVALVDGVLNHAASVQGRARNHAASDLLESNPGLKHANSESKDPLPEILSDSEDRTLVSFLSAMKPREPHPGTRWQDIRNRTAVAIQRGAGLTPLEIRMLKMSSVFVDRDPTKGPWKVRAPATGSIQAHDAPVAKWARPLLIHWLQVRSELGISGDWLLPSTKSGKQWGKTAQFDAVAEVLEAAGLVGLKGGSYRLRHTFAVRQLSRPETTETEVAGWMGIDVREIQRYRGVLMAPVDVT
jgi:site-specific recombinase XerD